MQKLTKYLANGEKLRTLCNSKGVKNTIPAEYKQLNPIKNQEQYLSIQISFLYLQTPIDYKRINYLMAKQRYLRILRHEFNHN